MTELEQKYYSPKAAQKIFSIGKDKLYGLLNEGKIEGIKVGKSTLIPASSIRDYFASCPKYLGGDWKETKKQ
ncbi:helix-turn-helix domain-containing protein [Acetobacteraceae bacterium]|nr:helix-turn-helix domain-containing protein [Acetobacteraceae bacterium]